MRIGLDGTPVWGPPVGQYTYMANLITALLDLPQEHDFIVYCRKEIPEVFQKYRDRVEFRMAPFANRKLCEQLAIPYHARKDNLDVLHTCWCRPYLLKGRSVFNIMGLEWRTHPDVPIHSRLNNWYYKTTIESTCHKADRLIAISQFMKDTFTERMQVPAEKIDVVYLGVNLETYRVIEEQRYLDSLKKKFNLPSRFLLFVGALLANKNITRIIEAYKQVCEEECFRDVGLVIAGDTTWNSEPLFELVEKLGLKDRIVFTGFISEEDKVGLYNLAETYVFPSLVEGFGLPTLEAFACGTPVITANVTAMPEVAGDAAKLVNPLSTEEIAQAMLEYTADENLRLEYREKGLARCQEFTWSKTAENMVKVYERACLS